RSAARNNFGRWSPRKSSIRGPISSSRWAAASAFCSVLRGSRWSVRRSSRLMQAARLEEVFGEALQAIFDGLHETVAGGPVDHAMVEGKSEVHHMADGDGVILGDHRPL